MISRWISRGRVVRLEEEVVAVVIMLGILASENLMRTMRSGNQKVKTQRIGSVIDTVEFLFI